MPLFFKKNKKQQDAEGNKGMQDKIGGSISNNLSSIKEKLGNSADVVIQTFEVGSNPATQVAIVYIEGIANNDYVHDLILFLNGKANETQNGNNKLESLKQKIVALGPIKETNEWNQSISSLLSGNLLIFIDGEKDVFIATSQGGDKRSLEEPTTQNTVRGPKDSFIEVIRSNTALIRKRIKNPNLRIESFQVGKQTKTTVEIMYIQGIAKEEIVQEIRERIQRIDIDSILESGQLEHLIQDGVRTPFPTIYSSERPDVVSANILEGRVAIFVDGTPFVLIAPTQFFQFFQSSEDDYYRMDIATFLRVLRLFMFFVSILAPSLYIAFTTFHPEMLPTELLIVVAAQRETVPFPAFFEALLMEFTFEILREAGLRMPRAMGGAISIVGALVIGQAAVQAGLVSSAKVIVVSITALANFTIPSVDMAISTRLIRFVFMIGAAMFGLYGIVVLFIILTIHLCSLRSFGIPYMTPIGPMIPMDWKDTLIRGAIWKGRERPFFLSNNRIRLGKDQKPWPPAGREMTNANAQKGDQNDNQ